jgi:hypothetical protein
VARKGGWMLKEDPRLKDLPEELRVELESGTPIGWWFKAIIVLRSMIRLARAGSPIDLVTIKSDLQDNGELERVGGAAILASLTDGTPRAMNIDFYAERIVRLAREREVVIAARNCVTAGTEGNGELEAAKNALLNAVLRSGPTRAAHAFEEIARDRYRLAIPEARITIEVDRLRRESHELVGELAVRCDLPGIKTYDGTLSIADFNLSSARARSERAKLLTARSLVKLEWGSYLEELCQQVLSAERRGLPAVDLRSLERPAKDDSLLIDGIRLPRRHPTILFADGGALKSYYALHASGRLADLGLAVAFFDWELCGEDHRDRLERLFGPEKMPKILYASCERPLVHEVDRLSRIVRDNRIDYAVYDSVVFACDGSPESAEVAGRYFRAVRQVGVSGSLHIAHTTKSEDGDQKPFGSVFWHNGARATYYAMLADSSPDGRILSIGFFNRKVNLGPKQRKVTGFKVAFTEDRTYFAGADPAEMPELAVKIPMRQRMTRLLKQGELPLEEIAKQLEAKPDTISRTVRRYKSEFIMLNGGKVGLRQRDT